MLDTRQSRMTRRKRALPMCRCVRDRCHAPGHGRCSYVSERPKLRVSQRPHLAKRLNSLVTQLDGIALSSPGKLDDRFGYHCHYGIIAIDQTQLTDCIFKRRCEHRDSVWPKDFLLSLGGVRKRHLTKRA